MIGAGELILRAGKPTITPDEMHVGKGLLLLLAAYVATSSGVFRGVLLFFFVSVIGAFFGMGRGLVEQILTGAALPLAAFIAYRPNRGTT